MSDGELKSVKERRLYNSGYEGLTFGNGCLVIIAIGVLIVICIFTMRYFYAQENILGILICPIITFLLGMWIYFFFESQQKTIVKDAEEQIARHETAIKNREIQEANNSRIPQANSLISQANEKLPDAIALVARIEAEIAHNKKIVRGSFE